VIDFAALPPEINSGRMYTGAGAGPLTEAAIGWEMAAAGMFAAAASFEATAGGLAASWMGPSSLSMSTAAQVMVAQYMAYGIQCEHSAAAAWAAAASYSTAFASHVPPPAIEANRDALQAALGGMPFTAPAVAALEAEYDEMWAQDAGAMLTYAGEQELNSSTLTSDMFLPTLPTSDGGIGQVGAVADATGQAAGNAAQTVGGVQTEMPGMVSSFAGSAMNAPMQLMQQIPNALQQLAQPLMQAVQAFASPLSQTGGSVMGMVGVGGFTMPAGVSASMPVPGTSFGATASMGRSVQVGRLSTPPGWVTEEQRAQRVSYTTPLTEEEMAKTPVQGWTGTPRVAPQLGGSNGSAVYPPHMRGSLAPARSNRAPATLPGAPGLPDYSTTI
jgi:PPE-repeat protein